MNHQKWDWLYYFIPYFWNDQAKKWFPNVGIPVKSNCSW